MKVVTISSKHQITLPKTLLDDLDIRPQSKLFIKADKDKGIVLTPVKRSIVEETAGSLTKYIHPSKFGKPFSEVREETQKIVAEYLATKK